MIVLPILMLVAALVTQLAGSGHLSRNGLVGIRIRSTRASDEAWRVDHRAAVCPRG
ncbi:MAG: SdpI family protein [Microbacteriaceae bacterium]|nr:MAG: SdpI family protein [Microbacteriaceae bacterium]